MVWRSVHNGRLLPRTWLERFPAAELNGRLEGIKQAKREGWDLEVLIAPGSREIVVIGVWIGFAAVPSGRVSVGPAA